MSLSPFLCSIHTHTTFCDGKGTAEEMAAAAFAAGVRYYGFSGHSYTPAPFDQDITMPQELSAYHAELLRLRQVYAGKMDILFGIEQDSCSLQPVPDWVDYWIGSVHDLLDPETGVYHTVDWDAEHLTACCEARFGGDYLALAECYFQDVALMAARKPTILGHMDLVTKLNRGNRFFDEDCPRYRAAALKALEAADPAATLVEINTGAISRGYRDTPYPAPFLLRAWKEMGGRIIITSDSHSPSTILSGYDLAVRAARAAGFSACALLTLGGIVECPLEKMP